jgi:hypothetical protein
MVTVSRNFSTSASGGGGDHRADPVAGQAVGLGEGIEVDQRVGPVGIGEQIVRRARAAVEIAVGLVDDQREPGRGRDRRRRAEVSAGIFHAAGIVGA